MSRETELGAKVATHSASTTDYSTNVEVVWHSSAQLHSHTSRSAPLAPLPKIVGQTIVTNCHILSDPKAVMPSLIA